MPAYHVARMGIWKFGWWNFHQDLFWIVKYRKTPLSTKKSCLPFSITCFFSPPSQIKNHSTFLWSTLPCFYKKQLYCISNISTLAAIQKKHPHLTYTYHDVLSDQVPVRPQKSHPPQVHCFGASVQRASDDHQGACKNVMGNRVSSTKLASFECVFVFVFLFCKIGRAHV